METRKPDVRQHGNILEKDVSLCSDRQAGIAYSSTQEPVFKGVLYIVAELDCCQSSARRRCQTGTEACGIG
jgi:hypothetical protein